ncbi:sensor domain-containing diguanylate cyclase [Paenibacillus endoradicis]|uniref:sensor domain-containing diguanylate cyclase n=1 Tax=Paenibacillus endoradicis TaxID=2972487 RepID=UPI002158E292|nr:sensor domain-containing diguanylate cyclase [Paenibacillus endoradicis]MCR8658744.1 sensor domain-containing diguanylate cyclase [Paenibacillus endoradicis]
MKISLKHLILSVALLSVILTLFSSTSSGYKMSKKTLIDNTLETNRVYAQKLANTTDVFFQMTLQTLELSAKDIASFMKNSDAKDKLLKETERLKHQTDTFNSVIIVDGEGEIVATSPQTLDLVGKLMDSEGGKEALREKKPIVSKPYLSITGRLIIFISYPIFDEEQNYLGLVGGSLYLKEENILNQILGQHYYQDGSYVYVVDKDGHIIYHQDQDRINDQVSDNPVVQQLMNKQSGAARVVNSQNVDMLAGYAYIPMVGWGVVSQRPAEVALVPTTDMMEEMILTSLPYLLLSLFIIALISQLIAQPLQKLAGFIESSTEKNQNESLNKVRAWYYEAIQLKKALTYSLGFLHEKVDFITHQSNTDPLTKLTNRRTLDEQTQKWTNNGTAFSIVILDIDHFKRVNDTYGHSVGDEVLKFLADRMREVARKDDICCRYGGEEFVLLLQHMNEDEAFEVAEKLRRTIESTLSPCGDYITISAGISAYPTTTTNLSDLFDAADQCLYEAKNSGRNQCIVKGNES